MKQIPKNGVEMCAGYVDWSTMESNNYWSALGKSKVSGMPYEAILFSKERAMELLKKESILDSEIEDEIEDGEQLYRKKYNPNGCRIDITSPKGYFDYEPVSVEVRGASDDYEWVLLKEGDEIREGDEFVINFETEENSPDWQPACSKVVGNNMIYRRKVLRSKLQKNLQELQELQERFNLQQVKENDLYNLYDKETNKTRELQKRVDRLAFELAEAKAKEVKWEKYEESEKDNCNPEFKPAIYANGYVAILPFPPEREPEKRDEFEEWMQAKYPWVTKKCSVWCEMMSAWEAARKS